MGYECFHCGQKSVHWCSDFDFEDYGLDEEGIVHICHCDNCGADIEYYVPIKMKKEEDNQSMNAFEIIEKANYDIDHIDHDKITWIEYLDRIKITKDVKPIVYGEWEYIHDTFSKRKCKECGYIEVIVDGMADNFCPNCGATMRKEKTE